MTGKILNIDAYPCLWPEGWERTKAFDRKRSKYELAFARARDDIMRQLKLLGAREIVVSTNIPLRRDGLPLAGMAEPKDPSVAVYWAERDKWDPKTADYKYKHRVIACDCWRTVRENLRAVGQAIESLRALKRCGATQVVERAFDGFVALPAQAGPNSNGHRPWREVLKLVNLAGPPFVIQAAVEASYKTLARERHPDVAGGSHDAMAELNRAREEAMREVQP